MQKHLPGFPGYSVTEDGAVFGPRGALRACNDRRGYSRVWCYLGGVRKEVYVHRAVALAWVAGDTALTVNHVDGNKLNNHASNLEWISNADNLRHSFRNGTHRPHSGKRGTVTAFPREQRDAMFGEILSGKSIRSVALANGVGVKTLQYQFKMNRSAA